MDEYNYNQIDPWDDGVYGTGKTKPPKSRGGIIALLLVVVIFLSGIASALGILNIKLFRQLNDRQESSVPMSFSICQETEAVLAAEGSISENIKSPKETAELVGSNGVTVLDYGIVGSNQAAFEVADKINGDKIDLIICNMITYATSSVFAPIVQNTRAPIVLLALQPLKRMDYSKVVGYIKRLMDEN